MKIDLSTAAIIEKNKVSTDGVFIMLLTISYRWEEPIRLAYNTEKVTFKGRTYYPFNFELSEVKQSASELPTATLTVSNITGTVQRILDEYNGGGGANVNVSVINTNVSDEVLNEENFVIQSSTTKNDTVSIKLGCGMSLDKRFPCYRIMKDWCQFKFKGVECGYNGKKFSDCNRSLEDCRERGNSNRFGGCPTIPQGGMYARDK